MNIHLREPWQLRDDHQFLKPTWVGTLSILCTIHVNIQGDPEHVPNKPLPSSPHGLRPRCPEGSSVLGDWWGSSENKYQDLPYFLFSYCTRVEMTCQWRLAVPSSTFPKWTVYRVRRLIQDIIIKYSISTNLQSDKVDPIFHFSASNDSPMCKNAKTSAAICDHLCNFQKLPKVQVQSEKVIPR